MNSLDDQGADTGAAGTIGWRAGAILIAYSIAAGLGVVVFSLLSDWAFAAFKAICQWEPWAPLVWTPLVAASIAWVATRWLPGAAGSGIPQVMAASQLKDNEAQSRRLASASLAFAKIGLSAGALLGGLSVGREGPAVHIAAGIMRHARRWFPTSDASRVRLLLTAGGAAGVAAAFNAPLAGVVFAVEQLGQGVARRTYRWVVGCVAVAAIAAAAALGNRRYFDGVRIPELTLSMVGPGLLVAVAAGMAGALFARVIIGSLTESKWPANAWKRRWPVWFAAACGLLVAGIGLASGGETFGSGATSVQRLLQGDAPLPIVDAGLKFVATWLTSWCGTSGGLLAPSLSMGAGIGDALAQLLDPNHRNVLIGIGMAAFVAAVTQTPLMAAVIVTEMLGGAEIGLALLPAALVSSALSRLVSPPLYTTLAAHLLRAGEREAGLPAIAATSVASKRGPAAVA